MEVEVHQPICARPKVGMMMSSHIAKRAARNTYTLLVDLGCDVSGLCFRDVDDKTGLIGEIEYCVQKVIDEAKATHSYNPWRELMCTVTLVAYIAVRTAGANPKADLYVPDPKDGSDG